MNLDQLQDILKDATLDVLSDDNFTHDFKSFVVQSSVIMQLCQVYEEGTGKEITDQNIETVKSFIKETSKVMRMKGVELNINNKMLNKLIDLYMKMKKQVDENNEHEQCH